MSRTWHKEREDKYTGSKRFDRSCRNHGSCPYCAKGRLHKFERQSKEYDEFLEYTEHAYHFDIEIDDNIHSEDTIKESVETKG